MGLVRHLSVGACSRHDRAWDGRVFNAPLENSSCLALKLIDLLSPQLPGLLQVQPDLRRCPKIARQAQCRVGRHAPLAIQGSP